MDNVPHYEKPEEEQAYYKKLVALLDHYEDGWNFFITAHKENNYDYPIIRKPEHENNPYIPSTWIELMDAVAGIVAKDKYELDTYPNLIEIIRADQMLDAYTTTGLPYSYTHWSFGKRRLQEERKFDDKKAMAYEIVINSNPCLSYCMDSNTPLLQGIVIAHAAYGHNAVFKNNFLFKEGTDADTILIDNRRLRDFVFECERKYGVDEVQTVLDFCHAMRFVDVSDKAKRRKLTQEEREKKARDRVVQAHLTQPRVSVFNDASAEEKNPEMAEVPYPHEGESNILVFMADHSPHLPEWKRHIMRSVSRLSQYFKPQMMTKVLNEGMATFVHDKIITTLRDIGIIDYGMYQEYEQINAGVLFQEPGSSFVKDKAGKEHEVLRGAHMNPYRLGITILREIERICKNPTEEDRRWFPHFAGDPDWLAMVKHAVFSSSDQTLIEQYLSPQAMRDLKMFAVETNGAKPYYEITAIHAGDGFRKIRDMLGRDYCFAEKIPKIVLHDYQDRTDRCLVLRHHMLEGNKLEPKDAKLILQYMHHQWEHPVVLESVDKNGKVVETFSSPENYDYMEFKPVRMAPKP